MTATETQLRKWGAEIQDGNVALLERTKAMWGLRHSKDPLATELLSKYVSEVIPPAPGANALLQHEAAYCLGQKCDPSSLDALELVIRDERQEVIVRHEAGEALAAMAGNPVVDRERISKILSEFAKSSIVALKETCEIGLHRLAWLSSDASKHLSKSAANAHKMYPDLVDPSPSFDDEKSVAELHKLLVEPGITLHSRYQALFSLRNYSLERPITDAKMAEIVDALISGMHNPDSALLRHEIAFVLAQLKIARSGDILLECLNNANEHEMVRHEAAIALGDVVKAVQHETSEEFNVDQFSKEFAAAAKKALIDGCTAKEAVVRDSCVLALELANDVLPDGRFQA